MHGKVLALDADGVLLDYVGAFFRFLGTHGIHASCAPHEVDDWAMKEALPQLNPDQLFEWITRFSVDHSFSAIPPIDGAVDAVTRLKAEYPDLRLIAITSAGKSEETRILREKNLEIFPFSDIHVLPLGGSKKEHLSRLGRGSFFVDDLHKNVMTAEDVGMHAALYRQPYNANDDHHTEILDWESGINTIRNVINTWSVEAANVR